MLAHTLGFMLTFGWDYLLPRGLLATDKRLTEHTSTKEAKSILRDKIMEMFSVKTKDYTTNAKKMEQYF